MNIFRRRALLESDPLAGFGEETPATPATPATPLVRPGRPALLAGALVIALIATAAAPFVVKRYTSATATGTVVIESSPAGRVLSVDGVARGVTPAALTLAAGEHDIRVGTGAQEVALKLTARAGETLRQNVVFEAPAGVPVATGLLSVATEPAGVAVTIDGTPRGLSPVSVASLSPGPHEIHVAFAGTAARRTVDLRPGETMSLVIPAPRAGDGKGAGWIAFTTTIPLRIFEGADLVGTSDAARLMLPAGSHTLEVRNDEFGYREKRVVQIAEAKTTTIALTAPKSMLNINAVPWAEVSVDGVKVGETPIGNYALAIGTHEVVFRHPQLGERRQTVAVKQGSAARIAVDFTK